MIRLFEDRRGATAVEFALVAPVFLMFMFLIIDGSRMVWTYQTLQEVATNSARCAALKLTACADNASVQTYAAARAVASGVPLGAASVTLSNVAASATGCKASPVAMVKVAINAPYQGATTLLLPTSVTTLTTEACFPA
jgi:Flp pilus assembly protein TadG